MKQTKFKLHRGVTLVEIAIVLVIIGLLLGGVLKGQELINNAKVRAIADRQASLKVAWFSFIDRYQALPGDYVYAARYIPGSKNGDGDGYLTESESPLIFQQLTAAGYLRCAQCTATETGNPSGANSLVNNYGGIMAIFHDSTTYAAQGGPSGSPVLMVHTGGRIPSNIISEVDRKLDDSYANTGDVAFSEYEPSGSTVPAPSVADCINDSTGSASGDLSESAVQDWRHATRSPPIVPNCGAAVRI